jgi:membrane-associated phospholipid phosphatase
MSYSNAPSNTAYAALLPTALVLLFALLFTATSASAQTTGAAQPVQQPTPAHKTAKPSLERQFLRDILQDQKAIFTSPFALRGADARWLVPLGASTAALIATDHRTAAKVSDNTNLRRVSRGVSRGGAFYTTGGIAAAIYLVGRGTHNARARETGLLSMEALVDSGILVQSLKLVTQRPRPLDDDGRGRFFTGGNAFPSGHAASAWSLATVIANEYGAHRPLVRFGAYGIATAISLSRYTGRNHFLSDVLVGSAIGYGIGRYVYHRRHDASLDEQGGQNGRGDFTRSKYFPMIAPSFRTMIVNNHHASSYGLSLTWNF